MIRGPSWESGFRKGTILWLLLLALVAAACSDASFVNTVTIDNPTDYPAHVEVSDSSRQEWLGLGIAHRDRETVIEEVADQGDEWVFRFEYVGKHEEEVEMSRADLEEAEWEVVVPQSFEDELRGLGVEPPP
jgi:hypothetical protein